MQESRKKMKEGQTYANLKTRLMVSYQLAAKGSRDLVVLQSHNLKVLFWTMNVVGSPPSQPIEASTKKNASNSSPLHP